MEVKKKQTVFWTVYILFAVSALSVWLVPQAFDGNDSLTAAGYFAGALFWLGLIGGAGYYFFSFRRNGKPEVFRFFRNKAVIAADIAIAVAVAASIYSANKTEESEIIVLAEICILLLGIYSHFLFGGKIFSQILEEKQNRKGD